MLKDLLQQRHEAQIEATNERLNQIYSKLEKEKDTKLHKIHNDYIKCKTDSVCSVDNTLIPSHACCHCLALSFEETANKEEEQGETRASWQRSSGLCLPDTQEHV